VTACPHPGTIPWRNRHLENAADDNILKHVVIIIAPLARWARRMRAGGLAGSWVAIKPDDQRKDDCSRQNTGQDKLNERKVD
jgi:hypothetical protein